MLQPVHFLSFTKEYTVSTIKDLAAVVVISTSAIIAGTFAIFTALLPVTVLALVGYAAWTYITSAP
jgi:hypothetical protein